MPNENIPSWTQGTLPVKAVFGDVFSQAVERLVDRAGADDGEFEHRTGMVVLTVHPLLDIDRAFGIVDEHHIAKLLPILALQMVELFTPTWVLLR